MSKIVNGVLLSPNWDCRCRHRDRMVSCWVNGRREFYDSYQEAYELNTPNSTTSNSNHSNHLDCHIHLEWADRARKFLAWAAAHTTPPVRQEKLQMWKDSKTYEGFLRSQYSENKDGEFQTTNELIEEHGEPMTVNVKTTNGVWHSKNGNVNECSLLKDHINGNYKKGLGVPVGPGIDKDVLVSNYTWNEETKPEETTLE